MGASYVILIPWKQCYLIVPIVSKRTEHISAGALEIMLASYVAWSLESSANHSCHPFQYEESSTPWSSPNYHHTDQYLTVNIDVLACMVSTSYLVQICRYAEMQICRYAPVSQDQKWHTQSGVTDPSGFNCCPSVRLKSSLDFPTVWQIESWEYFIYRPKYCLFAISAVGIPAMTNETDKHTLHRLYFLGIRKKP